MTPKSKLSALGYLVLVFLSGAVVGGFAYRLYSVRTVSSATGRPRLSPEEYRARAIRELTARLKLSQEQVEQLGQIMDETRQRYHEAHERYVPQIKAIENDQHARVRAILNDTQKSEYQKMLDERAKRRQEKK